jgi:hypothetical protein
MRVGKPRLKLYLNGAAVLVAPGTSGMTPGQMKDYLIQKHGSLHEAARSRGWNYGALCAALNSKPPVRARTHTRLFEYRQILGLPTHRPAEVKA